MDFEQEVARAIPPVIDTAADVYQGGQRAWRDAQALGHIAHDTVEFGVDQAGRAAAPAVTWGIDRGVRTVEAARDAFGWLVD